MNMWVSSSIRKSTILMTNLVFAAAGFAQSAVHELRVYTSNEGRQADVLKLIETEGVKYMAAHEIPLVGAWVPVDAKDERVITLVSHKDKSSAEKNWASFQADEGWKKALEKASADKGRAVKGIERFFLTTTDYSPKVEPKKVGDRVFELRTYVATKNNLDALNARFRNHTLKLFEKHGITNIVYWVSLAGEKNTCDKLLEAASPIGGAKADVASDAPTVGNALIYLITHKSQEAAQKSFGTFGQDPDWKKAREESEKAAGGSLTVNNGVKSLFLKPASFSPLQ